jgi:hypothetical protein
MRLVVRPILGTPAAAYLPAAALWVVTAIYLAIAYRYKPMVRAFPAGVAWIMLVLLSLDLASRSETRLGAAIMRWLNPAAVRPEPTPPQSDTTRRQVSAILWLAGFTGLLLLVGILAAVPIYVCAALRWRAQQSYGACLAGAAGATLFIWLLFSVLLRIGLYPGLVFGGA